MKRERRTEHARGSQTAVHSRHAGAPSQCPHAPQCVPCPFRGLPYGEQLARKHRAVASALAAVPSLAGIVVENVVGSRDLFGYRNVAKLAVRARQDGTLRAGVYLPGSHRLVDAWGCSVHHPAINSVLAATLEEATQLGMCAYDEQRETGALRYLVARYSAWSRRVLLILVTGSHGDRDVRELAHRLGRRCRDLGGIVHNVNAERGNVILGRHWATLRPPAFLTEQIGPFRLQTSPGAFLQANVWTARRIYETVTEWVAPEPRGCAIDLFCGIGPLTLHLAARAGIVFGIEQSAEAVRSAKSNARRNGVSNVRFRQGLTEVALPQLASELEAVDVVTLNPPRKGICIEALDTLAHLRPRRIAYVSCNPLTLARDLDRLATRGYRTVRVRPFDMLPQTDHVEVVALVEPAETSRP